MEALDNHRFPQWFTQSVLALGVGAVLLSVFRLPAAKLFIPILLLAVIAANISSTYTIRIPRSGERLSPLDSFVLLAVMLFGGEAALLFAAVTALCTSLRFGKNRTRVLFNSAVTVASIAIVIWALRFTYGPIIEADHTNYSADFLEALCIATLIQAGVTSTIIEVGSAYQINRSPLLNWGRNFLWTFVICLAGAIAAGVAATVILAVGFTSFVAASVIVALACTAFRIYRRNTAAGAPQAERYGPAIRDGSERFRSAFDHAAIGMALVSSEGRWLQVNRSLCGLLGCVAKNISDARRSLPTLALCGLLEEALDELGLAHHIIPADPFQLPLPHHVCRLDAFDRSLRRVE